ncbi:MAG TPA: mandelate racemase/muconate lactonizing enzyme family protein [Burkholderiales bacterium]|jgi:L-alanine-DL-glutamate epimerase-like enolase superfamily enzyme|nr:mandelate racemase/muconate lactonizing enzyme family protein [Burkholderiales bacterium]
MKITAIETFVLRMPLVYSGAPPLIGGQARTAIEMLLVRVATDEGIAGWGEGFGHRVWPATRTAIDKMVAPLCLGRDPLAIHALMNELMRALHGAGRAGPVVYALSAIDIALWDIAGKVAGLPLYRLLGGSSRMALPAYASLLRYGKAAALEPRIAEALARGYRLIKIHEIEAGIIHAARRAAGEDIPLMVDCNCPWTVEEALAMCRALRDLHLTWIEEPVWPPEDHAGLARVRAEGGIAVAAGENVASVAEFHRLFERGALSVAQPSVTKLGGVTELRKVFDVAEPFGVRVVPHSAYFGPGLLASIHVCAAQAREVWVERFYCDFDFTPFGAAIDPRGGRIAIPQGPGLGVDPDPDALKRLAIEA